MARIQLIIGEAANRLAAKALLEAKGHRIVDTDPDVVVSDDYEAAAATARETPTLVLASASNVPAAVDLMQRGVYGYVFLPLQPGELEKTVSHALGQAVCPTATRVKTLDEVEEEHILETLRACKNSRTRAADALGIGRNTLWRKLKRIRAREKERTPSS